MLAYLTQPKIDPVLLPIYGAVAIRWYSLMYVFGFLFGFFFLWFQIKKGRIRLTVEQMGDIVFAIILGILLGGRLGYILFYNLGYYLRNPLDMIAVWKGGMSFHGGLIGAAIGVWIMVRRMKINFIDAADVMIIPAPMGLAFGRIGNFINGELWGRPTTSPLGMMFGPKPSIGNAGPPLFPLSEPWVKEMVDKLGIPVSPGQTLVNLPRHPSQLYEMFLEGILLFFILFILMKVVKFKMRGLFTSVFFLGYGSVRFFVEFFREPDAQLGFLMGGWLTMGMLLSLPMIILGIVGLVISLRKKQRNNLWES